MNLLTKFNWANIQNLESKSFTCGYCGNPLASQQGYLATSVKNFERIGYRYGSIYICHFCSRPTYFDYEGEQIPGSAYGSSVENIDDESVEKLFQEARRTTSSNCFTATVLCCRKILMHVSVAKGAEENKSFAYYVKYLSDNHFVPPGAQVWVDHIRNKGNEANHEISIMNPDDAKELLDFCEMLLKIIFEFPANVQKKYLNNDQNNNTSISSI